MTDWNREAVARYRATHRDAINERARMRYVADPSKHRAAVQRSVAKDPAKYRALFAAWRKRPGNDIGCRLRSQLWQALKHRDSGRDWRSDCEVGTLIGCSKRELVTHIEAQFLPGMTWENYGRGGWEMDHINPCASFDLTDPEQQRNCFHFTNLRPRWAAENQSRRA